MMYEFFTELGKNPWTDITYNGVKLDGYGYGGIKEYVACGDNEAEFYSLYITVLDGTKVCIADVDTKEDAITLTDLIKNLVNSKV